MKRQLGIVTIALLSSAATCDWTVGDCYPVSQGFGNGDTVGMVGAGGGGPGDDIRLGQSQDALSGSECNASDESNSGNASGNSSSSGGEEGNNTGGSGAGGSTPLMEPQGVCVQDCEMLYDTAALLCGAMATNAARRSCDDDAYAAYKTCRDKCSTTKKTCLDMFVDCDSRNYAPCNKIIDAMSLCAYCQDDCIHNRPYKFKQCTQCGFE